MFCKNCGKELEGPAPRCPFCDTELAAQDAQPQQQTAAQAQSAPPPGARLSFFSGSSAAGALSCSVNVFQLPQSGQRPSQRGVS